LELIISNWRCQLGKKSLVRAERSVQQGADRPMAADINQSPEIARERQAQEKLLTEREANDVEKQRRQTEWQRPKPRQR
jgi:hypothetical protein